MPGTGVACAYCRFDNDCKAESILRSFIHQFLAQHPDRLLPLVDKYYKKDQLERMGPSATDIREMLHSLVGSLEEAHIVVDGLDEIASDKERIALLQELQKLRARTLIFSRPLDLHLQNFPSATIFSIEARDQDIENFVVSSLLQHPSFQETISGAQDPIVRDIAAMVRERCHGM